MSANDVHLSCGRYSCGGRAVVGVAVTLPNWQRGNWMQSTLVIWSAEELKLIKFICNKFTPGNRWRLPIPASPDVMPAGSRQRWRRQRWRRHCLLLTSNDMSSGPSGACVCTLVWACVCVCGSVLKQIMPFIIAAFTAMKISPKQPHDASCAPDFGLASPVASPAHGQTHYEKWASCGVQTKQSPRTWGRPTRPQPCPIYVYTCICVYVYIACLCRISGTRTTTHISILFDV